VIDSSTQLAIAEQKFGDLIGSPKQVFGEFRIVVVHSFIHHSFEAITGLSDGPRFSRCGTRIFGSLSGRSPSAFANSQQMHGMRFDARGDIVVIPHCAFPHVFSAAIPNGASIVQQYP
jgi:hypothetical protein